MMILSDARTTVDVSDHYVIQPQFDWCERKARGERGRGRLVLLERRQLTIALGR